MKKNRYPYRGKINNTEQQNLATLISQNAQNATSQSSQPQQVSQQGLNKARVQPQNQQNFTKVNVQGKDAQVKDVQVKDANRGQRQQGQNANKRSNSRLNDSLDQNNKPGTRVSSPSNQRSNVDASNYRGDHRNNRNDHRINRNKPKSVETLDDIKSDIVRIEKEIDLEISEIKNLKLIL